MRRIILLLFLIKIKYLSNFNIFTINFINLHILIISNIAYKEGLIHFLKIQITILIKLFVKIMFFGNSLLFYFYKLYFLIYISLFQFLILIEILFSILNKFLQAFDK